MTVRFTHVKVDSFEISDSDVNAIEFYTYGDELDLEVDTSSSSFDIYLKPPELRAFIEKLESIEKQMAKARLDKL